MSRLWVKTMWALGLAIVVLWGLGVRFESIELFQAMAIATMTLLALILAQVVVNLVRESVYALRLHRVAPGSQAEADLIRRVQEL